eukprot:gnl/TRDRNA2_/TRDRNA2_157331_c0_seq1.p2 gnl/TRDRNA2_/TRDRNA2_157331_c0~~gnl/TRDRNA2_/TRDRNA2_157331_c0_seq1.p2  ORF type:complete len:103 (+),score=10.32 gnl/TRDRNA2_/TRDRNA2_157331_c0_seq1:285-593(+)
MDDETFPKITYRIQVHAAGSHKKLKDPYQSNSRSSHESQWERNIALKISMACIVHSWKMIQLHLVRLLLAHHAKPQAEKRWPTSVPEPSANAPMHHSSAPSN